MAPRSRPQDVAFSLTTLKTKGHRSSAAGARHAEGRGRGQATSWSLSPTARPRRAALGGEPADFLESLLRTHPFDETSLEPPLGNGPYKVGKFRAGPYVESRAGQGLVGRESAGQRAAVQFRRGSATNIYRDREVAFEGFTGRKLSVPRGVHLSRLETRYDFPALRRPRQARDNARRNALGRAGLAPQYPPRQVQGPALVRPSDAFDFEWTNKNHHVRVLCPAPIRCSRIPT